MFNTDSLIVVLYYLAVTIVYLFVTATCQDLSTASSLSFGEIFIFSLYFCLIELNHWKDLKVGMLRFYCPTTMVSAPFQSILLQRCIYYYSILGFGLPLYLQISKINCHNTFIVFSTHWHKRIH